MHLIPSAIALAPSLHLVRSAAFSIFNPTYSTLSSTCLLHVIFWPSSLSLPIHFQHHCLQYIIIISSNHMSIPSYSIRLCILFKFLSNPTSPSAPPYSFYPLISLHTLISPWLFQFFSKLPLHSLLNTMSYFHMTLLILSKYDIPSFSFSKKTFFLVTTLRIL